MTQKIIVLKQVRDSIGMPNNLANLKEGDIYEGYRVTDIEKKECEHPKRRWDLDEQVSEKVPTVEGECRVCGDSIEIDYSENATTR